MLNFHWIFSLTQCFSLFLTLISTLTQPNGRLLLIWLSIWSDVQSTEGIPCWLLSVCALSLALSLCLSFVISHSSWEFSSFGVCFVSVCLFFSFQALLHAYCCSCCCCCCCFALRFVWRLSFAVTCSLFMLLLLLLWP